MPAKGERPGLCRPVKFPFYSQGNGQPLKAVIGSEAPMHAQDVRWIGSGKGDSGEISWGGATAIVPLERWR